MYTGSNIPTAAFLPLFLACSCGQAGQFNEGLPTSKPIPAREASSVIFAVMLVDGMAKGWPPDGTAVELYHQHPQTYEVVPSGITGTLRSLRHLPGNRPHILHAQLDLDPNSNAGSPADWHLLAQRLSNGNRAALVPWAHGDGAGRAVVIYGNSGKVEGTVLSSLPTGHAMVEVPAANVMPALIPSAVAPL